MLIGSLHGPDLAVELARIESDSRGVPRLTVKSDSKMRIADHRLDGLSDGLPLRMLPGFR